MFVHYFEMLTNFLYVCQSVSWLTYLLKIGQYRDISCSRWDIFQKFLEDIPWMFLHYFQINTNCLYVCQSVRWLTSLLKLDKCRRISFSGWDNFLIFFQIFLGCVCFQIITNFLCVCQAVSWPTSLMKIGHYRDISCHRWDIFLKIFGSIPGTFYT